MSKEQTDRKIKEVLKQTLSDDQFNKAAIRELAETIAEDDEHKQDEIDNILLETLPDEESDLDKLSEDAHAILNDRTFTHQQAAENSLNKNLPGRYQILSALEDDDIGQWFAIHDNNFDRKIAVKFLKPKFSEDESKVDRFLNEARVTSKLSHPNILPVHDFDFTEGGLIYFTSGLVNGRSLGSIIEESTESLTAHPRIASFDARVLIMKRVCNAIAHAHNKGIIHRDIKPENIFIGEHDEVLLSNWKNAVYEENDEEWAQALMGTPLYMSPEQARQEYADKYSDIYCLGATWFHLLTLRLPCWDNDPEAFLDLKKAGVYQEASDAERRDIPPALLAIAEKAMAPLAEDRYLSVDEIILEFEQYQNLQTHAAQTSQAEILPTMYKRFKFLFLLLVLLIVAGISVSAWSFAKPHQTQQQWESITRNHWDRISLADLDFNWQWLAGDGATPIAQSPQLQLTNGVLQVQGSNQSTRILRSKKRHTGSLVCNWEQAVQTEHGIISAFICGEHADNAYHYQLHTGENPHLKLYKQNTLVDHINISSKIQTKQFMPFEIRREQTQISFSINHAVVHTFNDPLPLSGHAHQQLGFSFSNGAQLKNVFVQRKKLPLQQAIDSIAARYFAEDEFEIALRHYRSIQTRFPDLTEAQTALYFEARCLSALKHHSAAKDQFFTFIQTNAQHPLTAYAAQGYVLALAQEQKWSQCEDAMVNFHASLKQAGLDIYLCAQLQSILLQHRASSPAFNSLQKSVGKILDKLH